MKNLNPENAAAGIFFEIQSEHSFGLSSSSKDEILERYLPDRLKDIEFDQTTIPTLAKDNLLFNQIDKILPTLPTHHQFDRTDAREIDFLDQESIHLVLTSPPYWNLKQYNERDGQLGAESDYEKFISELNRIWITCYKALVPGGRLICVVGDVCLSRRKNKGRHTVVPLHASIQEQCRQIGFDNLAPIIWHKISNASLEVDGPGGFLGKPFEPNAVIKNDIEFILMERKPGGYRKPSQMERIFSAISDANHKAWFNQIWTGLTGASTRNHPAPFPFELATRLIRMFSFVGDTVLDPFSGSGTTAIAAWSTGRNSLSVEIDEDYFDRALTRFSKYTSMLMSSHKTEVFK